jgi:glycosyltransferase involved in cell wall biosynthesis
MHENIIAISNFTKIELIKHYNIDDGNIEVIPVGINSNKFNPSNHSIDIRNKYGNNILLYSGLMTPRKRISVLLKAIPHVIKEIPEAHLILMGQGPSFKRYLKFSKALGIQDHVSFLGFVNDKELVKFYASSDIFVFPSELEGFGQVLLEAMASNTPVLCANKPPMSKIIGNGGLTFELNDHKDLAKKIINLLKNREILNELKNNTLNVIKNYEWMHVAQNFIDYIQKKQLNIMKARNYNAKYFNND